jgi:hypothetical protein
VAAGTGSGERARIGPNQGDVMDSRQFQKRLAPAIGACAVVALLASSGGATASPTAAKSACKQANNVEAIIDDSGSMSFSDPGKFRTSLLSAFVNIGANNGRVFGGGEFGSAYNALFGPATIPGVNTAMQASFLQVDADNGGTDYQLGFAGATGHNGTADARIFLTDGFPNAYPSSHLSPKVKTYVVGLGADFASDPSAQTTLAQIAAETGGPPPFLVTDPTQIQPVAGAITAGLDCKKPPLTFTHTFNKQGEVVGYAFKPQGTSADILISWGNTSTLLDPLGFSIQGGRGGASSSLATLARKGKAKLKVKEKKGATFVTVKLKGLKKGKKVKFKVKAKKLTAPTVGTTQIIK